MKIDFDSIIGLINKYFRFYFQKKGFLYDLSTPNRVVYRSFYFSVEFYIEPISHYIFIEVFRNSDTEILTLHEIVSINYPNHSNAINLISSQNIELEKYLKNLKKILEESCSFLFTNNMNEFQNLLLQAKIQRKQYTNRFSFSQSQKEKAQKAWTQKKYKEAMALYKSVEKDLNPIEQKRYSFLKTKYL